MADETDTTGEVARVLGEHYPDVTSYDAGDLHGCMGCGWEVPRPRSNDTDDWEAYWAHQAAMLAEAGLLRDYSVNVHESCNRELGNALATAEEAQIATQEPAGGTQGGSGDSRALGERLRALGTGQTRTLRKVLRAMADEADRLEVVSNGARIKVQLDRVVALADEWASSPAVGSSSAEQWEFDTLRNAARDLRDVLAQEVP